MSYSFSVKAATKDAAKKAAEEAYDAMVVNQPIHARDKAAAMANAAAVIGLLADDAEKHVSVSLNGYVSWMNVLEADGSNPLLGASVSASASLVNPD